MWIAIILFGVLSLHAAELTVSPRSFETEEACNEWAQERINDYIAINSTKDDPAHQVLAASFCVVAPHRHV